MGVTPQRDRSGSRVSERARRPAPSQRQWQKAQAVERADAAGERASVPSPAGWIGLLTVALLAGVLPGIYPFSPGYSAADTSLQVAGAFVAAIGAVAVVLLGFAEFRRPDPMRAGRPATLLYSAALLSTAAAAIHFAAVKMHFEEYALFGVFFVLSGLAQLGWALLVLARPVRWLLVFGLVGNVAIAALWAVDRLWGLPLGPEHWKPEPVGFADVTASAFEVVLAACCLALLREAAPGTTAAGPPRARPLVLAVPVVVLAALGLLSVMGIGSPVITPSK